MGELVWLDGMARMDRIDGIDGTDGIPGMADKDKWNG